MTYEVWRENAPALLTEEPMPKPKRESNYSFSPNAFNSRKARAFGRELAALFDKYNIVELDNYNGTVRFHTPRSLLGWIDIIDLRSRS